MPPATTTTTPLAIGSVSLRLYPHDLGAAEQVDVLRGQAALGVAAGYDGVMVSEHHAGFPGYVPNPVQLAQSLLAAMPSGWAAACPLLLPMLPYSLIAEQLAWLSATHPGRVGAGFASGALPIDFELAEVPFAEITERFEAALPRVVAALRGFDESPLGRDRAIIRCRDHPLPMVAAAQSGAAVRRAAALDIGVLYDSLQSADLTRRLSDAYDNAGGTAAKILIRRVWIGDPPTGAIAAQMDRYRAAATSKTIAAWGDADQLISGADAEHAARQLIATLRSTNCNAVNVRVHHHGLAPDQVEQQIAAHREVFVPMVRAALQPVDRQPG